MSEVSRRKLFAGLAVAPFAAALAASGDEAPAPAPAQENSRLPHLGKRNDAPPLLSRF